MLPTAALQLPTAEPVPGRSPRTPDRRFSQTLLTNLDATASTQHTNESHRLPNPLQGFEKAAPRPVKGLPPVLCKATDEGQGWNESVIGAPRNQAAWKTSRKYVKTATARVSSLFFGSKTNLRESDSLPAHERNMSAARNSLQLLDAEPITYPHNYAPPNIVSRYMCTLCARTFCAAIWPYPPTSSRALTHLMNVHIA